jgi:uncharacterized secreted protein with C-terminal beta-propeller domain
MASSDFHANANIIARTHTEIDFQARIGSAIYIERCILQVSDDVGVVMKPIRAVAMLTALLLAVLSQAAWTDEFRREPQTHRPKGRRARAVKPPAPSVALQALHDCDEARDYLIEVAVEQVLEYRYQRWFMLPWSGGPEDVRGSSDVPSDFTTTNNQEAGVDEFDIVKTNGIYLYAVEGEELHILQSWPAASTAELAAEQLSGYGHGLFLRGNRVLVSSNLSDNDFTGGTRLSLLDVSVPSSPSILRTIDIEGGLVDARLIDGDLYAVVRSYIDLPSELWDLAWRDDIGLPDMPWDVSEEERERILEGARRILEPLVMELMADYEVDDMLPQLRDRHPFDQGAKPTALLECSSLYRPAHTSNWSILSVLHVDIDGGGPVSATGLIADGWTVYASTTSLYVAQTSDWWWWGWMWAPGKMTTAIHKFELDPSLEDPVRYAASGEVDGWILDQFALSEHEGFLRVAATEFDWWWNTTPDREQASSVSILSDDGNGNLREVGLVGGLGPDERIFAVRFMGDTGYVVTFEQIDPLFTLDLSDPFFPKVVGELEVTGFSSYLHPIGNDWLLAVGQEADEDGRVIGLAVSIFDVRDPSAPMLAQRHLVENDQDSWSWSEAMNDHHAFTYHRGVLSIPAYIDGAEGRFSGLLVLATDPEEGIHEIGRIDHEDLSSSGQHAWIRRSIYIEDALYSLSSAGVKVNSLYDPDVELASVPFGE